MFWKSITLDNYLPFSHCGNRHAHLEFEDPATAILGNNGCGKSSLLRELTPYPATRTDFGKDGKIVKVLVHNGSVYELTSDFKSASAPHSFKENGVELNLSGTSDTQRDLVDEHFGVNKTMLDILAGKFKVCSASRAERKAIFSSTYPSDLSFVLEYHKKVSSDARACGNQLKLLKNREAEVRSYLIDDVEREKMERFKSSAESLIDGIDKAVLLIDTEIQRYKSISLKFSTTIYDYTGKSKEEILSELKRLTHVILDSKRKLNLGKYMNDPNDWLCAKYAYVRSANTADNIKTKIETLKASAESLRDELNKFSAAQSAKTAASGKPELESRLHKVTDEIAAILGMFGCSSSESITGVDFVQNTLCDTIFTKIIPHLQRWAENFHMSNMKLMTRENLASLQRQLDSWKNDLGTYQHILNELEPQIESTRERISNLASRQYPKDCVRVCPMRSTIESSIKTNDDQLKNLLAKKQNIAETIEYLKSKIDSNDPICRDQVRLHNDFEQHFMSHIRSFGLEHIAFSECDPYTFMNDRPGEAVNKISRACNNTINLNNLRSLESEKRNIESQLATIAAVQDIGVSSDLIDKLIDEKEIQLNECIVSIDKLELDKVDAEKMSTDLKKLWADMEEAFNRVKDIETLLNRSRCEQIIKYETGIVEDLLKAKHDISNQLFSISKTLNNQQKYRDILDSEILPTSRNVRKEKDLLETVAKGLSPNSGLPCIYLTRFINRIIARANAFIREVWYYDMELVYLEEEADLDFSIGILIRHSTTVKDLSLLSMGQRAIVDLAVSLAICVERGWFDTYSMMADEVDAALTDEHRTRLVSMISRLLDENIIRQLFLVNHFAIQTGMHHCGSIVLSPEGIVLPAEYNKNCEIA